MTEVRTTSAPLSGITVVDLSTTMPGAQCTQFLVEAGAEVVLVEPPGGSPLRASPAWPAVAGGKRSIRLEAGLATDDDALHTLLAGADVLVTTARPGVPERHGLGHEELLEAHPRLVVCSITGWGRTGPWAHLKGYEGMVMAKLGMFHAKKRMYAAPGPSFISVPYATWGAAQTATHGILAALLERESTGRGQHVEADLVRGVSMYDTWGWFADLIAMRWPGAFTSVEAYDEDGEPQSPMTMALLVAPTKDGHLLQFAQTEPRLFVAMMQEFGTYDLVAEYMAGGGLPFLPTQEQRSHLWEAMIEECASRTLAEWEEVFRRNPNLFAEVFRRGPQALEHPQIKHDGRAVDVRDPERGVVRRPSPLVHSGGRPLLPVRPAPRLGEHDGEIQQAGPAVAAGVDVPPDAPARLPLEGVTILEFGLMFAAPFGATMLTDLGARVIKVETLGGDTIRKVLPFPESGGARVMQGKESIAVDLATPAGKAIIDELVRRSDVVLQAFRAGAAERAGLGEAALLALNPDLVYVNAPGYGTDGPYGAKPAYAPSIAAITGMSLTDAPDAEDAIGTLAEVKETARRMSSAGAVPVLQADGMAALAVASTILLGVLARRRGRQVRPYTLTMIGTATNALTDRVVTYEGRPPSPLPDLEGRGWTALYRMYQAAEGWVFLAAPEAREWAPLVAALREQVDLDADPRFRTAAGRAQHDQALAEALAGAFEKRPAAEWEAFLAARDVGAVEVTELQPGEFIQGRPELLAEYAVEAVNDIFEEHMRVAPPVRFSRSLTQAKGGCSTGEHTDAILREIGRTDEDIAALRAAGVVG